MDKKNKRDAATLRVLLDLASESGISMDCLLADTGLNAGSIYQPCAEIEMWQELMVIEKLSTKPEPLALAIRNAKHLHITTLGTLGFAMLSSQNVFHALELAAKYHSISLWFCDVTAQIVGDDVELLVLSHSLPTKCRNYCSVRGLASLKTWFSEMLARDIVPIKVQCMMPRPEEAAYFEEYFNCEVEYEADAFSISFGSHLFDEPLRMSDKWARKRCELELDELKDRRRSSFANRVRDIISFAPRTHHSEDRISEALQISGSTLRRRLREEGTTFREVRAETLHSLACIMLTSSSRTVDEVAYLLGYSEAASFVRSFKRRENIAPGTWRKNSNQIAR